MIFPGRKIDRLLGDRSSLLRPLDFGGDDRRDAMGDLVLKVEDVLDLAVVALRPQMMPGGRVDQLRGDAQPIAAFAYATFEDVTRAQFLADLANVR